MPVKIDIKLFINCEKKLETIGVEYINTKNAISNGKERLFIVSYTSSEVSAFRMEDPSKGGIGKRLKSIRVRLIWIIYKNITSIRVGRFRNLIKSDKTMARRRLLIGPAREILTSSHFDFRLYGLTETGFPQPNPATKSIIVPIGSRWRNGFREILPSYFAVGSPNL